jgi:sulfite reductase beta subunit-like hemoprotein
MRPTEQQHREALAGHADRLARFLRGQIPGDSWRPIRLSYGLYYQLDHTSHMQRIKIPGGLLTAAQLDAMAEIADLYGRGIAHVTTRQDIQIHWVPLDRIIDMYERLLAVDITTRGACADSVRNVTACPYAGVHPDEPFDVAPYCMAVHDYFLFNPLNLTLPRKFKIAVEGCPEDCAQVPVNDIGLYAKMRDEVRGFAVWAVGGLGAQPFLAKHITDFIPAEDILIWCEAIVRVQHRHGERKNRSRARMKYVVKRLGLDGFRALVEEEVRRVDAERGAELRADLREHVAGYPVSEAGNGAGSSAAAPRAGFEQWRRTNARPQRQKGHAAVVVQLPLGDITSEQMRAVGTLVRSHGNGTLRTTNDQNLVLPWIPEAALPAVHAALVDMDLGNADAGTLVDVVSCPGMDYCLWRSHGRWESRSRVRAELLADPETGNGFAARLGRFGIKVSGAPPRAASIMSATSG